MAACYAQRGGTVRMAPAVDALSAGIGSLWGLMRDLTLPLLSTCGPFPRRVRSAPARAARGGVLACGEPWPAGACRCALAPPPPPPPSY